MFDWVRRGAAKNADEVKALDYAALAEIFGVVPTITGDSVSVETAMTVPALFGTVKTISESVAQIPLMLYRRTGDTRERATDHPVYPLLHDMANAWTPAYEFRLSMETAALLHGNAYAWIGRAGGEVKELVQLPSQNVTVEKLTSGEPIYKVSENGQTRAYGFRDILHIRSIGTCIEKGDSPVHRIRNAIAVAIAAEEFTGRNLSQGLRPSGVLKVPGKINQQTLDKLREGLNRNYAGAAKAGKPMLLEDGLDWQTVQQSAEDAQLIELRKFAIAEIARAYRLPLTLIGELENATLTNTEQLAQQFITFTLQPWLMSWEGAVMRSVLTPEERRDYYPEHLIDALVKADIAARFGAYAVALGRAGEPGFMERDEIRARENLPPMGTPKLTEPTDGAA